MQCFFNTTKVKLGAKYYNWQAASTLFFSLIIFNKPVDEKKIDELQESSLPRRSWFRWSSSSSSSRRPPDDVRTRHVSVSATTSPIKSTKPSNISTGQVPNSRNSFDIREEKRLERSMSDPGNDFEVYSPTTMTSSLPNGMKKTINLGSDDLKKLNLKYGENEVCFWVTTMYQGMLTHSFYELGL